MASVTDFINSFSTELSRPHNFEVLISPSAYFLEIARKNAIENNNIDVEASIKNSTTPQNNSSGILGNLLQQKLSTETSKLRFRCEASSIPGRTFGLIEQKIYGPVQRHPISNFYGDIRLTFICDDSMFEKIFFDAWLDVISLSAPESFIDGNPIEAQKSQGSNMIKFDFAYKDEYTSSIKIVQKDVTGEPVYEVSLIGAFPYAIDPMPLNWRHMDSYHRINVSFTYNYYITNKSLHKTLNG